MSSSNVQILSGLLVAAGVGLCATFGAQLTPKTLEAITIELNVKPKSEKKGVVEEPIARVTTWWSNAGVPFSGGLLLIFVGSFMARSAKKSSFSDTNDPAEGAQAHNLTLTLESLTSRLEELLNEERSLTEIKQVIEGVQDELLNPLIEGRETSRAQLGTALFIDVFGPIAQGERKLNRAWAACVDKHQGEAIDSISRALEAFKTSLSLVT